MLGGEGFVSGGLGLIGVELVVMEGERFVAVGVVLLLSFIR